VLCTGIAGHAVNWHCNFSEYWIGPENNPVQAD
jgi:hypothetical protein